MPYASSITVLALVPGIKTGLSSTADALNANLRRADDLINGELAKRYSIPFTSTAVPPLVRTIAEDLASGMLFRSLFTRDSQNKSDWTQLLMEKADRLLDQISKGEIDLASTSGALLAERGFSTILDSSTEKQAAIFDLDSATSWNVSANRLETIASSKR